MMSIERRGKNNPNWTGGSADLDAYGPNWNKQKRKAKDRDNLFADLTPLAALQEAREPRAFAGVLAAFDAATGKEEWAVELFREYGVRYLLLDTLYVQPEELKPQDCVQPLGRWGSFGLWELRPGGVPAGPPGSG